MNRNPRGFKITIDHFTSSKRCSQSIFLRRISSTSFLAVSPFHTMPFHPFLVDSMSFSPLFLRIFCGSKIHDGRLPRPSCTAPACRGWTWQVTKIPFFRDYFSRECSFQPWIFRGHVSFQKSNPMEEVLKLHSVENVTPWMCPFRKIAICDLSSKVSLAYTPPTQDASHHQDSCIVTRESQKLNPLLCHGILGC